MKFDRDMQVGQRGAATVSQIGEVSPLEAELILNLRLWQDGESGQRAVWRAYAHALGPQDARVALDDFAALIFTIESNMLRPLVRHGVACGCVGSDEAVFANMVRMATAGELHEASMIATLMVRPAHAERVALMAAGVGATLQSLVETRRPARDRLDGQRPKTFH